MPTSAILQGLVFYVWYPKDAKHSLQRCLKKLVNAGAIHIDEPLNPAVHMILVFRPEWTYTNLTLPVDEPTKNPMILSAFDDWTPTDLVAHFARLKGDPGSVSGRKVNDQSGRPKTTRVFNAMWLNKVIEAGRVVKSTHGDLPFPEYEIWASMTRAPTPVGPAATSQLAESSAGAAARPPSTAFLWRTPTHIPGAWVPNPVVDAATGVTRKVSAHDPDEWLRWKRSQRPEDSWKSIPSHRIPRPNLTSILARPEDEDEPMSSPSSNKEAGPSSNARR